MTWKGLSRVNDRPQTSSDEGQAAALLIERGLGKYRAVIFVFSHIPGHDGSDYQGSRSYSASAEARELLNKNMSTHPEHIYSSSSPVGK